MKTAGFAILAAFASASAMTGAQAAPARDWSRMVVATPQGGFRMGNPNARVKLVEYGSLACPHCRHFEETGYPPLVQNYVKTGRVSYEFRNLLLNAPDIAASLLAHCAGPSRFFPMAEVVYRTQPQWSAKVQGLSDAQASAIDQMSESDRIVRMGQIAGFPQVAARFGLTPAQSQRCLTDPKGLQRLLAVTEAATNMGITHTPTFIVNGKISNAAVWEELEPQLKAALR